MVAALPRDHLRAITVYAPKGDRDLFPIKLGNYDEEVRAQKSAPLLRFRYAQIELRLDDQVTTLWLSKSDLIEHFATSLHAVRDVLSYFPEFIVQLLQDRVVSCTRDRFTKNEMLKAIEIAHQHFNHNQLSAIRKQATRTILVGNCSGYILFTKVQHRKDFCIGAGVTKRVKLAMSLFDTRIYAVGVCRKELLPDAVQWDMAINEIEVLKRLRGRYGILQIRDFLIEDAKIYLITELMNQGDLQRFLASKKLLTLNEKFAIARQIAHGLRSMHDLKIIHRDFRPENIFLSIFHLENKRVVKAVIGDLGAACFSDQNNLMKIRTGSKGYLAPERDAAFESDEAWIQTSTPRADIWALGLTLYSLFHPQPGKTLPFQRADNIQNLTQEEVHQQIYEPIFEVYIQELLESMLQVDPAKRANIEDVCEGIIQLENSLPPEKPGADLGA